MGRLRTEEHEIAAAATAKVAPLKNTNSILEGLQVLGPQELGMLIGRSPKSIKVDALRRPETLPPRFVIPGTRKLLYRVKDVMEWMDALAEIEMGRRAEERRLAKKYPTEVTHRPNRNFASREAAVQVAAKREAQEDAQ